MQNPFEEINTRLDEIENAIFTLESKIKIHETALKKAVDSLKTITLSSAAPKKRYLNVAESAQYLGIARNTMYRYRYRLPYIKKGGRLYYLSTDLDEYLENKKLRNKWKPKPKYITEILRTY